jgi:hypothetical protein
MNSLKTIRANIALIQDEIKHVKNSIEPVDELESRLRQRLESYDPYKHLIDNAAACLETGQPVSMLPGPSKIPAFLLGVLIRQIGVGTIISEAAKRAEETNAGRLRIPLAEKRDRLEELRLALYEMELEEQQHLNGAPNRPDVSGFALLQIPVDVMVDRGIFEEE